jgi:hypothetical protein
MGIVLMVFFCITGCSKKHFYTINDNSLSLYYYNKKAKEVLFASSIDRFTLHPAFETNDNFWEVSVPLQEDFAYFYIVDGIVTLPDCTLMQNDDFGSKNCLFVQGM